MSRGASARNEKPRRRLVELMRRDSEVHQDADYRITHDELGVGRHNRLPIRAKVASTISEPAHEPREVGRRRGPGIGIAVDAQDPQLRSGFEQCRRMPAAPQRGVDDHPSRQAGEQLCDFTHEHRLVVKVLGHLQPFNRQDRREGGGGFSTRLDDCQAAHGPRPVLQLHSLH